MQAPVAQLDRASGYEPEGRQFESVRAHHLNHFKINEERETKRSARSRSSPVIDERLMKRAGCRLFKVIGFTALRVRTRSVDRLFLGQRVSVPPRQANHPSFGLATAARLRNSASRKVILEKPGHKEWATSYALPIGRWNQPDDLVGAVLFLCSHLSDMVVGHVPMVDGGWTIQ